MVRIMYYPHNQWMDKYLVGAQDLWQLCFVVLAGNPPIKGIPCTEKKMMNWEANIAGKPVVTATHMLE
jgi:hypothetical protein